ncbi:transporter family protein [Caldanaerobius fijiensis DSM 17918]|uniref:Transporter family protein n=1 Tax=Caldanaerobius fijiensis DSM 17918 TaxID=1121256 RepID=A0A1M5DQA5_9THEO|nr:EamA family transporter [Caldanaerobius fijiensis]SHF69096.1 transporter family protein [Caldanaerobius fijiensis DSM 17918]HOV26592.1 EamA family transporter [Pseudobacteroides sp.]
MNYLWLIFALLSAITAALVSIFGKIGLKGIDANTATAVRSIIMAAFLVFVVLIQGKLNQIPSIISNRKTIVFIVLSGIAGALSWLFYFMSLNFGKVSQVAPIDKLSVVFAVILSILFLGEKVSIISGLGVGLIAIGAILVALG